MFSRKVHNLRHFRFCDLVRINAAFADSVVMDMQHDARRGLPILVEKSFQHMNDEIHRRVIVVEQQDAVETRLLGLHLGFRDDRGAGPVAIVASFAIVARRARCGGRSGG